MMVETAGALGALLYGTVLLWAAVNITSHLTRLVRVPRPAHFVCVHMTAVWMVGLVAVVAGLSLIGQGITALDQFSH